MPDYGKNQGKAAKSAFLCLSGRYKKDTAEFLLVGLEPPPIFSYKEWTESTEKN